MSEDNLRVCARCGNGFAAKCDSAAKYCSRLCMFWKHGHSYSPEYKPWKSMLHRCSLPNASGYKRYGGRGIRVCERWQIFGNFLSDMGRRPSLQHSIDRINNDGNYEPGNCRWATKKQQSNNTQTNRLVVYDGKTMTVTECAEKSGVNRGLLYERLESGMSLEEALSRPKRKWARKG